MPVTDQKGRLFVTRRPFGARASLKVFMKAGGGWVRAKQPPPRECPAPTPPPARIPHPARTRPPRCSGRGGSSSGAGSSEEERGGGANSACWEQGRQRRAPR